MYTIYGAPTPICTGAHKYLATALYLCLFFLWTVYTINTYLINALYSYVIVTSHFKKLVSPLAEHWLSVSYFPTINCDLWNSWNKRTTIFRRISSGKLTGAAVWESLKLHNDLFINIIYYYIGSWCLRTILCVLSGIKNVDDVTRNVKLKIIFYIFFVLSHRSRGICYPRGEGRVLF